MPQTRRQVAIANEDTGTVAENETGQRQLGRYSVYGLKFVFGLNARVWAFCQPIDVLIEVYGNFSPKNNPSKTCAPISQGTS